MNFTTTAMEGYLRILVTGDISLDGMKELVDFATTAAKASGMNKLALDTRGVEGDPSEMDRFYVGEYAAKVWRPPLKVVILDRASRINKFAENTAVNRGAKLLITSSSDEGMQWLLE